MNVLEARRRLLGRNVYKRTTEGNPAIAQGSLARRYPGITMQGWTEQDSTTGAQLFDKSTAISGKYISDTDGKELDGEGTYASDYIAVSGLSNIICSDTKSSAWMAFYDAEKTYVSGRNGYGAPIPVPENAFYARFTIANDSIGSFMLNEGSILKPYEPYTGGQPSPNPDYPQPITSAGKYNEDTQKWEYGLELIGANLFDISLVENKSGIVNNNDGSLTITTVPNSSAVNSYKTLKDLCPGIKPGTYFLHLNTTGTNKYIYIGQVWNHGESKELTEESLKQNVLFCASGINTSATIKNIMINFGTTDMEYQPYQPPQSVTLTSDRPLTKWDKLEKRNGQWGWVYKSNEIVLDGSEGYWQIYPSYKGYYCGVLPFSDIRREGYAENIIVNTDMSKTSTFSCWLGVDNRILYIINAPTFNLELEDVGLVNWREWLSENPITIMTYADEETFVPLTESEQEAMNALHTFRPTTVLSNDAGCNMELTYKTKKNMGGG